MSCRRCITGSAMPCRSFAKRWMTPRMRSTFTPMSPVTCRCTVARSVRRWTVTIAARRRRCSPALRRQRPELAEAINSLLQDHSMIDHLLGGLRKVLDSSDSTSADVTQHLDGISAVMETHFRYEEKVLAAALDELADPDLDLLTALGPLADVR